MKSPNSAIGKKKSGCRRKRLTSPSTRIASTPRSGWRKQKSRVTVVGRSTYELIQEARTARQEGFLAYSQNESKVEELQLQVEQLQDDLEDARNSEPGEIDIAHEEFVTAFLTESYQPVEKVLHQVTDSGVLTGIVKDAVEEQLFDLAEEDKVECKQGYGWRLAHGEAETEAVEA